ncbi:MAG: thiamine pyrophosphate-dependent enzyme, partial [Acutalibacteraceae bacterium]|nr:thiamine pyrophosphate-dependent enzyme [Acutalibacteraceae bacterium]
MWTAQYVTFEKPRKFVSSGGLGTMGFGMGAAIGAQMASNDKTVLITGDGSFGMNLNELATAVSQNVPLVIVIMNNNVLGMVRQWQTMFYNRHYSSTTLDRKTDFVMLAEAFGAKGFRADSDNSLDTALKAAFSYDGTTVIDCLINCDERVLPMIPPGGAVSDLVIK